MLMKSRLVFGIVMLFCGFGSPSAYGNLIINGSFEVNTAAGQVFNPSNATFNGFMSNVTAYGPREGIDIQTDTVAGIFGLAPISGDWKVSPAADLNGTSEEFSLDLNGPINAGTDYDLSFFLEGITNGPFLAGPVEIGLSSSATSFGTQVFTATSTLGVWTQASTTFTAPINASHLTVRVSTSGNHWVALDAFSLVASQTPLAATVPEPITAALGLMGLGVLGMATRRRVV